MNIDSLAPFAPTVTTALVVLGMVIFRKDIGRLVTWIVTWRRVSRTKEGLSLEAGTEPTSPAEPVVLPEQPSPELLPAPISLTRESADVPEPAPDWMQALKVRDWGKAIRGVEHEIGKAHDEAELRRLRSLRAHFLFEKDQAEGLEAFNELFRLHPRAAEPRLWLALSLKWKGAVVAALEAVQRGLNAVDEKAVLYGEEIALLIDLGRLDAALAAARRAIEEYPRDENLLRALADLHVRKKELSAARIILSDAVAALPLSESLFSTFASFLADHGTRAEAAACYSLLVQRYPAQAKYRALLGNQWLELGLNDSAMEAYREAQRLAEPHEGWILANIGNLLINRGFYSDAQGYLNQALELDPNSQYIHDRLAKALTNRAQERTGSSQILEAGRALVFPPAPAQ